MKDADKEILILQENLEMLRKLFGWSAQQLGDKLGVTKQTILNLERKTVVMSRIQYIAIRAVFETEAELRPAEEKKFLLSVMYVLFNREAVPDEQVQRIMSMAENMSKIKTSTDGGKKNTPFEVACAVGAATAAVVAGIISITGAEFGKNWLPALLKKDK